MTNLYLNLKKFVNKAKELKPTKRNILSLSASIYDPLGLITPITTRVKVMFQLLCRKKVDWDDAVENEVKIKWDAFLNELDRIKEITIRRFVFYEVKDDIESVEIHGFSDSSLDAYAAVIYLRVKTKVGIKVSLITSKSKVAPMKKFSVPRLELLACVLLAKLMQQVTFSISSQITAYSVFAWTDSKVTLCWIKEKCKWWKPWIENRVVSIRKVINEKLWNYVPTSCNPADIPTRSNTFENLIKTRWYEGPHLLRNDDIQMYGFNAGEILKLDEVIKETRKEFRGNVQNRAYNEDQLPNVGMETKKELNDSMNECNMLHVNCVESKECDLKNSIKMSIRYVIEIERYSSLRKLIRVTGYVMRFVNNLLKIIRKRNNELIFDETLSMNEYNAAKNMWIKDAQLLASKKSNYSKLHKSLNIFEGDDGLLRLRGRFGNCSLDYDVKYPALLSGNDFLIKLIILQTHEDLLHNGVEATLTKLRKEFWIVKGRKTVKDILRSCVICKRYQGKGLVAPMSPDLPDYRLEMSHSFQATGLDYAGPLFVKDVRSDKTDKVYILLLTCATSRAIHLELTHDMTFPSFFRGFKRFVSRRGAPSLIVHDNAATFTCKSFRQYLAENGIQQKCILAASPWWGGFYERLVRSVKLSLRKVLGKALLTFEELQTVLCEVEYVINSRPLIYISEDDLIDSITPFHLMFGRDVSKKISDVENLKIGVEPNKKLKSLRMLLDHYWKRFTCTYLSELRQHHIYEGKKKTNEENSLVVGDVVLIKADAPTPRSLWRKGKIEKLVKGKDEKVRGAILRVITKKGDQEQISRPIQKLIPFEIVDDTKKKNVHDDEIILKDEKDDSDTYSIDDEKNDNNLISLEKCNKRPKRRAAEEGERMRRLRENYR